jgi:hypothetical protein
LKLTFSNNKLDIIIHDNKKRICLLIDTAIYGDQHVTMKEAEKVVKYKDLALEIQCLWNVKKKKKVMPVITGATETTSKSSENT